MTTRGHWRSSKEIGKYGTEYFSSSCFQWDFIGRRRFGVSKVLWKSNRQRDIGKKKGSLGIGEQQGQFQYFNIQTYQSKQTKSYCSHCQERSQFYWEHILLPDKYLPSQTRTTLLFIPMSCLMLHPGMKLCENRRNDESRNRGDCFLFQAPLLVWLWTHSVSD